MGLFSSIGKFIKKIGRGIGKVFDTIMKPIKKLFEGNIGKIILTAVAVFSMGTALLAGAQGFMSGTGFVGKFLNGGKAFLNSLLGTNFNVTDAAGGGSKTMSSGGAFKGASGEGALAPQAAADMLTGVEGATGMSPAAGAGIPTSAATPGGPAAGMSNLTPSATGAAANTLAGPTQALAESGGNLATRTPPAAEGNWLTKAANAALDFAKTEGGSNIIGNMISGAGAGMAEKNRQEFDSRVERMFADPNNAGMRSLAAHDYSVDAPSGLPGAINKYAQRQNKASGRYTPTVPYRTGG